MLPASFFTISLDGSGSKGGRAGITEAAIPSMAPLRLYALRNAQLGVYR
jgi:hypothetical protein